MSVVVAVCLIILTMGFSWAHDDIVLVVESPMLMLANGRMFPRLGFGCAGLGSQTMEAVSIALEVGYRSIDTAQATEWYSEKEVANAIAASGIGFGELFITSKIHPRHHGMAAAQIEQSLETFGTLYLDAMLLHFPECWPSLCGEDFVPKGTWRDSWRQMEDAYFEGKVKAIGVSNFRLEQLHELHRMARVQPHLIQNWADPFHQSRSIRLFAQETGAVFVAYSSLGTQWAQRQPQPNPVLSNPILIDIAKAHQVEVAQIVLAFFLALNGTAVIPRSRHRGHIEANFFHAAKVSLSAQEMAQIMALDQEV